VATARLDSTLSDDAGWTTPHCRARRLLRADSAGRVELYTSDDVTRTWDEPLSALAWLDGERRGGRRWVGFIAYELGRWLEPAAGVREPRRQPDGPLFAFLEVGDSAEIWTPEPFEYEPVATSNIGREDYLAKVARCVDYIGAGDVFQVNLARRISVAYAPAPTVVYGHLMNTSPAAYGGMIDLGDVAVVSNSPELFLRVEPDGRVVTRPIKGTRPPGIGMREALESSPKEAAELHMIVDLMRNDLGRVCEVGSVLVERPREVEAHPRVLHGVATVAGRLRREVGLVDLLSATFPPGSITGAPKIRAMQIIDELEPGPRGAYCGAIGHLDPDGSLQFNVAIRTATFAGGRMHFGMGGGIVADSEPRAEWQETRVKARNLLAAAGASEDRPAAAAACGIVS
jgi:anthranilate/para-aminobenzoate synthase component I